MSRRAVCIHGHFYQPPRENPWTGTIERQPTAAPHPDWNARISAECYAPNSAARLLDERGDLRREVNNYSRMSFDFGPTLLAWLEPHAPEVYRAILRADRESAERFGGHGAAMAQVYNHMIVPLAAERDRACQVAWGVRDFRHRFGRSPEGMWLPETAVDLPTLEALAAAGIRFTVLAPHQARRVRRLPRGEWSEVTAETLDTTLPYEQRLPSGRRIALFFYHGPVSAGIAFEGLLEDGARFAERLREILPGEDDGKARLAHVATDGESYGHHHEFGEMALAWVLDRIESDPATRLTHYAAFLAEHPPARAVEIAEATSWSCTHGVERWRADCGCGAATAAGWSQAWRAPLREAFDWLRDRLAPEFERRAGRLLTDPWRAREEYVDVLLDDRGAVWDAFVRRHAARPPTGAERATLRDLLEMERLTMLMYTSCAWFFEDLARVEPLQVLRYAGRAAELARALGIDDPEPGLLERLERARSNRPERGNGRDLYLRHVTRREPTDTGA